MLPAFSFNSPSRIVFGPGKLADLEQSLSSFGSRPLLVLGKVSFAASCGFALLEKIFDKLALPVKTIHIPCEPSPAMIDAVVVDRQYADIDVVIGVGGGSTLDAGKAISAMLAEGGIVSHFLDGIGTTAPSGKKLPFIAIPTTSGTGSEATSNAVLSAVGEGGFKKSLRHNNYFPNLALVDPLLTLTCPKSLTVSCGMDCYTQLVESYLSTGSSPLTDALALEGIKKVSRSLPRVAESGEDLAARSAMSYGSLLSGMVLANGGLGTVHGFAGAVGGLFAIPHGVVCGSLMAATNKATLKRLRSTSPDHLALGKYSILGKILSNRDSQSDSWYQDHFIASLEKLTDDLAIPSLWSFGLTEADAKRIAAQTTNKNNPAILSQEELVEILCSKMR